MSIRPGSRAAAAIMLLAAVSSPAQEPSLCGRDIVEAFDRLGTPATRDSDWDDTAWDGPDWTPDSQVRDFPRARFSGRARALVTSRRIEIRLDANGDFAGVRERLLRELPGIDCGSRTIRWPPEPEPVAEDDLLGPYTPVWEPEEPQEPRDVELGDCEWAAPAGQREGLTKIVATEHYGYAMRNFTHGPEPMDWPERTLEIECVHEGELPYNWGWRWRNDGWPGMRF